jgi:F-box domain
MPSIPIDVLREILEHVDKADLPTLCRVNKIFCSCSQDVLYRELDYEDADAIQTLAGSTDLARRVRSFHISGEYPELATALRNMSSLRSLDHESSTYKTSFLDGCTFKLDSFETTLSNSESLQKFLKSQTSLTSLTIWGDYDPLPPFDERCLPNLTRVMASPSWLRILIPGRPVREVILPTYFTIDLSVFTLSTNPIQKLRIHSDVLYPKPESLLVSIFPSLVHLVVDSSDMEWIGRVRLYLHI